MQVRMQSETREPTKGKQQRREGPAVPSIAEVVEQTAEILQRRSQEWVEELTKDPSRFAEIERDVHAQLRQQADLMTASMLAESTEKPEMVEHAADAIDKVKVPLRQPEKKSGR